jgi:hypothetical protein
MLYKSDPISRASVQKQRFLATETTICVVSTLRSLSIDGFLSEVLSKVSWMALSIEELETRL